jgi:ABC-2 type transport system permease protein
MRLRAFLKKEWFQLRRNVGVVLVLLILLPGGAALGTAAYQQTIPEDVPVGIVPADDRVTQEELGIVHVGASIYASPIQYETTEEAIRALEREEVYLVLVIPHGLLEEDASVTVTQVSDQRLAQFREPANYTEVVLSNRLNRELPSDVTVEHQRIGIPYSLSEYLVPPALMLITVLFAFVYFPFELYREKHVYDRVDILSQIESAITAKIAFHALLLLVPITIFRLVGFALGYRIQHFGISILLIMMLSFLYMAALSGAIMFAFRLRRAGVFLNFGVLAGVLAFSSLVFPVGFLSSVRKSIALHLPTYHSMVILRGAMMKEMTLRAFADRLLWLLLFTAVTIVLLRWGINHYRRAR